MVMYIYHTSDFEPGAPKVLPAPLIAGALFFSGGSQLTDDVETFLTRHSVNTANAGNIWMVLVWDASKDGTEIATAAFTWTGTEVELLAIFIDPTHPALPIRQFLLQTGAGLFGGRPVVERAPREEPIDCADGRLPIAGVSNNDALNND